MLGGGLMKSVVLLQEISKKYAYESDESEFEIQHLNDVVHFAEYLSKIRGLNKKTAQLIAYGHDLGRTKENIFGKAHARVGAQIVREILAENTKMNAEEIDRICKAISKHSKKNKLHGQYAELIKDADALAHNCELLIDEKNWVEQYRVIASDILKFEVTCAPINQWFTTWQETLQKFCDEITVNCQPNEDWVHKQRIRIRQIKGMHWYFIALNRENRNLLKKIDSILNRYFKVLDAPRKYEVVIELMSSMKNSEVDFVNQLQFNFQQTTQKVQDVFSNTETSSKLMNLFQRAKVDLKFPTDQKVEKTWRNEIWKNQLEMYIKEASFAIGTDINTLHDIRIKGKWFKYLGDLDLLHFPVHVLSDFIRSFHKSIGDIHDIQDLQDLYKAYAKGLNAEEKPHFQPEKDLLVEKCNRIIFFYQLLARFML